MCAPEFVMAYLARFYIALKSIREFQRPERRVPLSVSVVKERRAAVGSATGILRGSTVSGFCAPRGGLAGFQHNFDKLSLRLLRGVLNRVATMRATRSAI